MFIAVLWVLLLIDRFWSLNDFIIVYFWQWRQCNDDNKTIVLGPVWLACYREEHGKVSWWMTSIFCIFFHTHTSKHTHTVPSSETRHSSRMQVSSVSTLKYKNGKMQGQSYRLSLKDEILKLELGDERFDICCLSICLVLCPKITQQILHIYELYLKEHKYGKKGGKKGPYSNNQALT